MKFFALRLISLALEFVLLAVFVRYIMIDIVYSKVVINVIVIMANYFASKLFVFK